MSEFNPTPESSTTSSVSASGVLGRILKSLRSRKTKTAPQTDTLLPESDTSFDASARPGFILESDRYTRASWERQGSGWM